MEEKMAKITEKVEKVEKVDKKINRFWKDKKNF